MNSLQPEVAVELPTNNSAAEPGHAPGIFRANHMEAPDTHGAVGYLWAICGVASATALFWLLRGRLDQGQACLLYLPVVITCAVCFDFGPAVMGAVLSFCAWDFFFISPYYTLAIGDFHNWLSLFVFLVTAIATAGLASRAKSRAQESEAREREMAVLYQASEALSGETESDRLLMTLIDEVTLVCNVCQCMVIQPSDDSNQWPVVTASKGPVAPDTELSVIHTARRVMAQADSHGGADRLYHRRPESEGRHMESDDGSAGLYVLLKANEPSAGVLHVGTRLDHKPFSMQDKRLILTLSNQAAVVMARQALIETAKRQAQQAAVLNERNRLARDVHDTFSHSFTGIKFLLEAAARIGPSEQSQDCIQRARVLATEGAQEARRSVWALRPAALESAGNLASAVRLLVSQQTAGTGLAAEITAHGDMAGISSAVEENMLRICQEAVTNVLRHAGATRLDVHISGAHSSVEVVIRDNGRGFDTSSTGAGFGLTSMRERAEQIEGVLQMVSRAGHGTRVSVLAPLNVNP